MTATLHRIGQPATDGWEHQAACLSYDEDLFFPDSYRSNEGRAQVSAAKSICSTCPVRQLCLNAALKREDGDAEKNREGIWGGYTPSERWVLARMQQLQAAA